MKRSSPREEIQLVTIWEWIDVGNMPSTSRASASSPVRSTVAEVSGGILARGAKAVPFHEYAPAELHTAGITARSKAVNGVVSCSARTRDTEAGHVPDSITIWPVTAAS